MIVIDHTDRIFAESEAFEVEFEYLWEKKHCKWFFPKRRREKLRRQLLLARKKEEFYNLIGECISEILPEKIEESLNFFADVKDINKGE